MTDFKDLKVWQKAHSLALDIHKVLGRIRGQSHSGLKSQMMRAAMSIPTNIVESRGQATHRESSRFIRIALNSTTELEYHLLLAAELDAITRSDSEMLTVRIVEIRKMLYGMLRYLSKEHPVTSPRT